jgi:5''-phosphoribostamycin phosphatase/probable phosphoglycerate mutase
VTEVQRFILLRHAEATLNLLDDDDLMEGFDGAAPLTARGEAQAQAVADALVVTVQSPQLFTSPQRRAAMTARAVGATLAVQVNEDPRLREVLAPERFATPMKVHEWDRILEDRLNRPEEEVAPGVESVAAQRDRATRFLNECCAPGRGTEFIIVSHAETLLLLLFDLLGLGSAALKSFRFSFSKTGITVIERALDGHCVILTANSKSHLRQII